MSNANLLAEVLAELRMHDRLNKADGVDLTPHAAGLERLKAWAGDAFEEMREEFTAETSGTSSAEFVECLQNLFEMYLDPAQEISKACPGADDRTRARIHTELEAHVARLALG